MESATKSCQLGVELTIKMGFFELLIEIGGREGTWKKTLIRKTSTLSVFKVWGQDQLWVRITLILFKKK